MSMDSGIDNAFSTSGAILQELPHLLLVGEPHHALDPARLYQLRSKITTSPAAGKCRT